MHTNSKIDLEQVDSKNEKATRRSKSRSWFSNAAMVLLLANLVGVVCIYASGRASTTSVENRRLVDGHGDTVQVALKDVEVDIGGNLVSRSTGNPLHTAAASKTRHSLTSLIPDKYLVELEYFSYTDELNNEVYVKVHSFARHPEEDAHCGSVVRLVTSNGNFTLDDTHIYHADGKKATVAGHFDVERRLGMQHGRKLYTKTLDGFFAFIEKSDFKCTQEWKGEKTKVMPEIPKVPYTLTEYKEYSCEADRDNCFSMVGENVRELKPGVTEDGKSILTINHILVTESQKITVSYMPNQPTSKQVKVHNTDGSETIFQLFKEDMTKLHCSTKDPNWFSNRAELKAADKKRRLTLQQGLRKKWQMTNSRTREKNGEKGMFDGKTFEEVEKEMLDQFDTAMEKKWAEYTAEHKKHGQTPAMNHNWDDSFVSYLGTVTETYMGQNMELRHFAVLKKETVKGDLKNVDMSGNNRPMLINYFDTVQKPHNPFKLAIDISPTDVLGKIAGANGRDPKATTRMINFKAGLSEDAVNAWVKQQFGADIDSTDALNAYAEADCEADMVIDFVGEVKHIPTMNLNPYFEEKKHVQFFAKHYDPNSQNMRNMPITERLYWSAAKKTCTQAKLDVDAESLPTPTTSRALQSRRLDVTFVEQRNNAGQTGKCLSGGIVPRWHYFHNKRGLSKEQCEAACLAAGIDNCAGYMFRTGANACGFVFGNGCKNSGCSALNYYHGSYRSHLLGSVRPNQSPDGALYENTWTCWKAVEAVTEQTSQVVTAEEYTAAGGSCIADINEDDDFIKCRWKETIERVITDDFAKDMFGHAVDIINAACGSGLIDCPTLPTELPEVPSSAYEVCTTIGDIIALIPPGTDLLADPGLVHTFEPFSSGFLKNTLSLSMDIGMEFYTDDRCILSVYGKLYSGADGQGPSKTIAGMTITPTVSILLGQDIQLNQDDSISFPPFRFEVELALEVMKAFCVSIEVDSSVGSGGAAMAGAIGGSLSVALARNANNDPPYCAEGTGVARLFASFALVYSDDLDVARCYCNNDAQVIDPGVSIWGADISARFSTAGPEYIGCPSTGAIIDLEIQATLAMTHLCKTEMIDILGELTASASVGIICDEEPVMNAPVFKEQRQECNYCASPSRCGPAWHQCDWDLVNYYHPATQRTHTSGPLAGEFMYTYDCWETLEVSMDDPVNFLDLNNLAPGVFD